MNCHEDYIYTASILDNSYAITGSRDRHIHLWDLEATRQVRTFQSKNSNFAHESTVYHVSPYKEGLFLSGSRDGSVKLWDIRETNPIKHFDANQGFVYSVAGLDDGTIVAGTDSSEKNNKKGSLVIWPSELFKA